MTAAERDELRRRRPDHRLEPRRGASGAPAPRNQPRAVRRVRPVPQPPVQPRGADGGNGSHDGHLRPRPTPAARSSSTGSPCEGTTTSLREEIKPWSYMKFPYVADLGPARGWYKVGRWPGPELRLHPQPQAEAEREAFIAHGEGEPSTPLAYHWARMIEMLHAAEVIRGLPRRSGTSFRRPLAEGVRGREGVGIIEAPRGTLIPPLPSGRRRSGQLLQPDRIHHPQQPGDEQGGTPGRPPLPRRPPAHRRGC